MSNRVIVPLSCIIIVALILGQVACSSVHPPTPTLYLISSPTSTSPTPYPTPTPTVNLSVIKKSLDHLTSFSMDRELWGEHPQVYHVKWVNAPFGQAITDPSSASWEYRIIGAHEWARLPDGKWISCANQEELNDDVGIMVCGLGTIAKFLIDLSDEFPNEDVEFVSVAMVNQSSCYKYVLHTENGDTYYYLEIGTERPILIESPDSVLRFGHFNDPSNAITPPLMTEELPIEYARMAINSLTSFQYTTDIQEGEFKGVYVQSQQAWYADFNDGDMYLGSFFAFGNGAWSKPWVKLPGEETWSLAFERSSPEGLSNAALFANPFSVWTFFFPDESPVGTQQSGEVHTIANIQCQEYLFIGDDRQIRLCVTSVGMPLRTETSIESPDGSIYIIQELSHLDDAGNSVEIPEEAVIDPIQ